MNTVERPVEQSKETVNDRRGKLASLAARVLLKRGKVNETTGAVMPRPAPQELPVPSVAPVTAPERQRKEPEIVKFVSNLASDESIRAEKKALGKQLADESSQSLDEGQSREYYRIKANYEATHTELYPRISLSSSDLRAKNLESMFQSGPKLERGTWMERPEPGLRHIRIHSDSEPFTVPMSNVVNISSFDSWQGRGERGQTIKESNHDYVKRTSADTITMYASFDTPPPPIDSASAYVQPNGVVFYSAHGGAHRTAAAMARGDEYLQVDTINIYQVDHDYFEMPEPPVDHPEAT